MEGGAVIWPRSRGKKPCALVANEATRALFVPSGWYVVTRRFSAKEEPRRIVAAVYDPTRVDAPSIAFENHLNYYHINGRGMPAELAKGLAVFLNATCVDTQFRQFNGHTQVNATDLRKLGYPSLECLERLGSLADGKSLSQEGIDALVEGEIREDGREAAEGRSQEEDQRGASGT